MNVKQIVVQKKPIRLGQFLKLANMVQDGLQGKIVIQNEEVLVNNVIETRRGKQLCQGDVVHYNNLTCQVHYRSSSESDTN